MTCTDNIHYSSDDWPYCDCNKVARSMFKGYPVYVEENMSEKQEAVKHDQAKPGMALLPTSSLVSIAEVLDFGARKYAAHNWRKGMDWSRLLGSALRHLTSYNDGEDKDSESGLSHLAHLGCCVLFLLEYENKKLGKDDRYKAPAL